ncbi:MAG TPA: proton-conducting transporter membrane subunit [Dehalococcoidia bacterium]|nr:proton-conducting transporter membrane subunit [Dehalococcoidia bacterium]
MSRHLPVLIFAFPFLTGVAMPLVGLWARAWCRPLTLIALSGMSLLTLLLLATVVEDGPIRYAFGGWAPPVGIEWVADGLSSLMMVALSLIALLAVVYAGSTLVQGPLATKTALYYTLVLLLVSGLTGIVLTADLFNLFVFLELTSLSAYALVGVAGGHASLAAFRYLILGTTGASLYLLGVSFLYAATGTLNMADAAQRLPALLSSHVVLWGSVLIMVGLAIKMALVPLHGWLPDAYTHAPDAVSTLIAPLITKVSLYALFRIAYWVFGPETMTAQIPILPVLSWIGAGAALVGACLALIQRHLKRMFAYGGIAHIGLSVLGFSLGNQTGFAGGVFYLITDAVMQAGLFFVAAAASSMHGVRELGDLERLRGRSPWTLAALIVTALSMIGFPPTGGFFGKWYLVLGALERQHYLGVAAIIGSTVLTLAYFFRIFEKVYLEKTPVPARSPEELPWTMRLGLGVVTLALLILGFGSDWLIALIHATAVPKGL